MSPLITASNLWVSRGQQDILQDVSLTIGENDFITVVGPNGAGKSMLLKCLIGLYKPNKGTLTQKSGVRISYVPQHFFIDHAVPISARRFLTLRYKDDTSAIDELADATEVADILDKPLHVLSGGQLQRLLLTRALIQKPSLLVLDEASQNLDIGGQLLFYKLLEKIYRDNAISILMVSHDLHFVMRSTKQVICLFHHICCSGKPADIAQTPEFLALFGDEMGRLMTVYRHIHGHTHE